MFKSNRSKNVVGVLSLLLLVSLAPSANAGKPGSTPSLNGTLCKSFGGTWKAGKTGTCSIYDGSILHNNNQNFVINLGDKLYVSSYATFSNYAIVTNYGTIQKTPEGGFISIDPGKVINYGLIQGCLIGTVEGSGATYCS